MSKKELDRLESKINKINKKIQLEKIKCDNKQERLRRKLEKLLKRHYKEIPLYQKLDS